MKLVLRPDAVATAIAVHPVQPKLLIGWSHGRVTPYLAFGACADSPDIVVSLSSAAVLHVAFLEFTPLIGTTSTCQSWSCTASSYDTNRDYAIAMAAGSQSVHVLDLSFGICVSEVLLPFTPMHFAVVNSRTVVAAPCTDSCQSAAPTHKHVKFSSKHVLVLDAFISSPDPLTRSLPVRKLCEAEAGLTNAASTMGVRCPLDKAHTSRTPVRVVSITPHLLADYCAILFTVEPAARKQTTSDFYSPSKVCLSIMSTQLTDAASHQPCRTFLLSELVPNLCCGDQDVVNVACVNVVFVAAADSVPQMVLSYQQHVVVVSCTPFAEESHAMRKNGHFFTTAVRHCCLRQLHPTCVVARLLLWTARPRSVCVGMTNGEVREIEVESLMMKPSSRSQERWWRQMLLSRSVAHGHATALQPSAARLSDHVTTPINTPDGPRVVVVRSNAVRVERVASVSECSRVGSAFCSVCACTVEAKMVDPKRVQLRLCVVAASANVIASGIEVLDMKEFTAHSLTESVEVSHVVVQWAHPSSGNRFLCGLLLSQRLSDTSQNDVALALCFDVNAKQRSIACCGCINITPNADTSSSSIVIHSLAVEVQSESHSIFWCVVTAGNGAPTVECVQVELQGAELVVASERPPQTVTPTTALASHIVIPQRCLQKDVPPLTRVLCEIASDISVISVHVLDDNRRSSMSYTVPHRHGTTDRILHSSARIVELDEHDGPVVQVAVMQPYKSVSPANSFHAFRVHLVTLHLEEARVRVVQTRDAVLRLFPASFQGCANPDDLELLKYENISVSWLKPCSEEFVVSVTGLAVSGKTLSATWLAGRPSESLQCEASLSSAPTRLIMVSNDAQRYLYWSAYQDQWRLHESLGAQEAQKHTPHAWSGFLCVCADNNGRLAMSVELLSAAHDASCVTIPRLSMFPSRLCVEVAKQYIAIVTDPSDLRRSEVAILATLGLGARLLLECTRAAFHTRNADDWASQECSRGMCDGFLLPLLRCFSFTGHPQKLDTLLQEFLDTAGWRRDDATRKEIPSCVVLQWCCYVKRSLWNRCITEHVAALCIERLLLSDGSLAAAPAQALDLVCSHLVHSLRVAWQSRAELVAASATTAHVLHLLRKNVHSLLLDFVAFECNDTASEHSYAGAHRQQCGIAEMSLRPDRTPKRAAAARQHQTLSDAGTAYQQDLLITVRRAGVLTSLDETEQHGYHETVVTRGQACESGSSNAVQSQLRSQFLKALGGGSTSESESHSDASADDPTEAHEAIKKDYRKNRKGRIVMRGMIQLKAPSAGCNVAAANAKTAPPPTSERVGVPVSRSFEPLFPSLTVACTEGKGKGYCDAEDDVVTGPAPSPTAGEFQLTGPSAGGVRRVYQNDVVSNVAGNADRRRYYDSENMAMANQQHKDAHPQHVARALQDMMESAKRCYYEESDFASAAKLLRAAAAQISDASVQELLKAAMVLAGAQTVQSGFKTMALSTVQQAIECARLLHLSHIDRCALMVPCHLLLVYCRKHSHTRSFSLAASFAQFLLNDQTTRLEHQVWFATHSELVVSMTALCEEAESSEACDGAGCGDDADIEAVLLGN